jgi:hypothetical protein
MQISLLQTITSKEALITSNHPLPIAFLVHGVLLLLVALHFPSGFSVVSSKRYSLTPDHTTARFDHEIMTLMT